MKNSTKDRQRCRTDLLTKPGFNGPVKVYWPEGEPRDVILLEDLRYVDTAGNLWVAHAGVPVNGASIPRFCWRVLGSPFCGLYRRASVIHDAYCGNKERPWRATHKVFLEMMLFDRVPKLKALLMFHAVWLFGPRWVVK